MKRIETFFLMAIFLFPTSFLKAVDTYPKAELSAKIEKEDSEEDGPFSANIGATSEYMSRGVTWTDHKPAIQGGLDWKQPSGFRLGAWGSNVYIATTEEKAGHTAVETDLTGGYTYSLLPSVKIDLGVLYVTYFGESDNYWEVPLEIRWNKLKAGISFIPKWYGTGERAWYFSLGYEQPIFQKLKLGLSAGYSLIAPTDATSYADFKVSAMYEVIGLDWELAQIFSDHRQFKGTDSPRVVLTISKSF